MLQCSSPRPACPATQPHVAELSAQVQSCTRSLRGGDEEAFRLLLRKERLEVFSCHVACAHTTSQLQDVLAPLLAFDDTFKARVLSPAFPAASCCSIGPSSLLADDCGDALRASAHSGARALRKDYVGSSPVELVVEKYFEYVAVLVFRRKPGFTLQTATERWAMYTSEAGACNALSTARTQAALSE